MRMGTIESFVSMDVRRRPTPFEILGRIQEHFVGRVLTLAAAAALCAILSVALLPLATRYLETSDYGTYGLLISIVALMSAATDGGTNLLIPAHYGPASASEKARLFATLAVFAGISASAAGLSLIALWYWLDGVFSGPSIPLAAIILAAILIPLRTITNLCVTIFSVTGRGPAIAAQMAIQSLVVFISTLVSLFEFRLGGTSLFVGAVGGQFAALCVGLFALGRDHMCSWPSHDWLRHAALNAPTTATSGLVEGGRGFGENALLASAAGLHAIAILIHARLYHGLLMALSNSVGHNLWSKSLEEARNPNSSFEFTRSAWTPVQITITCAGLFFALLGTEIVAIISNGKFVEAATYIPAFFVIALIQITEQPSNAIVYASGNAASATWARTLMTLGSIILLCPTIVWFGIKGVLTIVIIETVAYRLYLRMLASRERPVPFQDHVAVFGSCAIIAATAYVHWATPPLTIQLLLMAAGIMLLVVIIGRRAISEMISAGHQIVLGQPVGWADLGWSGKVEHAAHWASRCAGLFTQVNTIPANLFTNSRFNGAGNGRAIGPTRLSSQ
jgi:O-antigen/teichoic acid export membrane protein